MHSVDSTAPADWVTIEITRTFAITQVQSEPGRNGYGGVHHTPQLSGNGASLPKQFIVIHRTPIFG